ncbi:hypothetical protein L1987_59572 [Smallanthus sonchifolius]|uniref:Uncharacterized protein n=1 Tax=Smallanthus sonchifolius TaxID=185202 RepID=A0ACB9D5L8_9ASTR|nr:hypothetical protein L1987_59572 [Smallanthus sonchifolius]
MLVMSILILFSIFITITVSHSKPSHHDGGFTVDLDLIHRDSPLSPLYNPTYSLTDRHQNAFLRSMSQAKRARFPSKIYADISGDYIMKIQIRTPPVEVFGVLHAVRGIVGLGGGPLSLINQLEPAIQGKFSYCLTKQIHDASNQTSKIYFGDHVNVSWPNVVSTPLINNYSLYFVNLIDVLVGNKSSSYNHNESFLNNVEDGNIIMDMGSTFTSLPREMYLRFAASITKAIGGETVDSPQLPYSICYKDLSLDRVPAVTFRFSGADVEVPPVNMLIEYQYQKGVTCLAIISDDYAWGKLGNLFQRNLMVGFDLIKQKVYFKPTDCTRH